MHIGATAYDDLPAIRLTRIGVHGSGHDNDIQYRLHGLGHHGLQGHAGDRQAKPGHLGEHGGVAGGDERELTCRYASSIGPYSFNAPISDVNSGDLAALDDVHAELVGSAGKPPDHRIMARDTSAWLNESAENWVMGVKVQAGCEALDLVSVHPLGVYVAQAYRIEPAPVHFQVMSRVGQGKNPTLTEHEIEVQFSRETFEELNRTVVEG